MKGAESDGNWWPSWHQIQPPTYCHYGGTPTLSTISQPTRVKKQLQTLIDLCFVSALTQFTFGVTPLAGIVTTCYFMHLDQWGDLPNQLEIHSFKKCNLDTPLTHLQETPWGVMDVFISIDDKWDYWKTLFMRITNEDGLCTMVMQMKDRLDNYAW